MGLVFVRIGEVINENVTDIIHFLHGLFYDIEEVKNYIDFSENEEFRKELGSMAITGEHLITFGRHLEQEKTKEAEKKVKEAKQEAEKVKQEAENKIKEAENKTKEAENRAEALERELEELRKRLG